MALFDDISDGVKKAFLAGVGAVATGAEKSQELIDELVRKGELTVEQGKTLNEELTRKVRETAGSASDEVLRARMRSMSTEERAEWVARAQKIAQDLDAEDVPIEVDVEEAPEAPVSDESDETTADDEA